MSYLVIWSGLSRSKESELTSHAIRFSRVRLELVWRWEAWVRVRTWRYLVRFEWNSQAVRSISGWDQVPAVEHERAAWAG